MPINHETMLSLEGQIVNSESIVRGRIEISDNGLISEIAAPTGRADLIFADELIFPGFIDVHVHARECADHSQDYKEDFVTAGEAAINGGVVAFADMPNNSKPPVDDSSYAEKCQLAAKCPVEAVLYAGIGTFTRPLAGPVPYKVYLAKSVGDLFFESLEDLDRVLKNYRGEAVSFHCEDPEIIRANQGGPTPASRRPAEAEISAVDFALKMIQKHRLRGKICHISTQGALQKIAAAKKAKAAVTCEVAPHHLYFDSSANLQMNPPLRTRADRLAMIEGLRSGEIDFLATDHAPHTWVEKQAGIPGLPHLDTYGPFVTWLMAEHHFAPQDIARFCAVNPGQFISQFMNTRHGKIEAGYSASLTVIEPNHPTMITRSLLKTKCGWSPFEGVEFPGRVKMTILKGKISKL